MSSVLRDIRELYYITHIDNIPSILDKGILSHEKIIAEDIAYTPIYDNEIVIHRSEKIAPNGKDLWSFANLFFQPRNPMLFRVLIEKERANIAVISVSKDVLNIPGVFVTTGNAANNVTEIKPIEELGKIYREIKKDLEREYWTEFDGSKRRIMAECLVPDQVPPSLIISIYVANHDIADELKKKIGTRIEVIPHAYMFFQPEMVYGITPTLFLVEGDMFFSRYQTITISVNCVGVMGKGIASRAKYQYPDVYVHYQDSCRNKKLQLGKPHLFKREVSSDYELADEPDTLTKANHATWFLLFATKQHWRLNAEIEGIEKGLQWIVANYKKEGITSLALPALGCGLGNLSWEDVGPLMCKYLSKLEIPVRIYLPLERKTPEEFLTQEFLLK
jgi:O-acetyl-ADP-ribose deacetylase (regulator of RNase III)